MITGPEIRLRILEMMNLQRERHVVMEDAEAFEQWILSAPPLSADGAPPAVTTPRTPRAK